MNPGKTLFSQMMDFVPWKTFGRIVARAGGDAGVRTLPCVELFRVMAFAQLTWRESLRDIEVCLGANRDRLYHMGIRRAPARSTLADALNGRDWRIYCALAQRLIFRARQLYAREPLGVELEGAVYALDATTPGKRHRPRRAQQAAPHRERCPSVSPPPTAHGTSAPSASAATFGTLRAP